MLVMFALFSFLAGLVIFVTSIMLTIALRKVRTFPFSICRTHWQMVQSEINWKYFIGIWEQNSSMAVVICCLHNSTIFGLAFLYYSQWPYIRLQYLYMFILGTLDCILHLELASSLFIIRWAERPIEIRRFGPFTSKLH